MYSGSNVFTELVILLVALQGIGVMMAMLPYHIKERVPWIR